ncbi:MAG: DNA-directed DNA polymerase [Deltaproteobacteria bacterium]|nr:DNA-directed DNA polymerase [Deltaproteobacteria bacterium]
MEFFLTDIDYDVINESLYILLFGRDSKGKRVVVLDKDYSPYFYVLPSDKEMAKREIEDLVSRHEVKFKSLDIETKTVLGQKRELIRVNCLLPQDTQKVRDIIKNLEKKRGGSGSIIEEYEYQMGFYRSYLVDKDFSCLDWFYVSGDEKNLPFNAEIVIEAKEIKKINGKVGNIRALAFDTEVLEEKRGERQLVMISLFGENFKKVLTYKTATYPNFVEVLKDEREIIKRFVELVNEYDPDVIVGFNSDLFDFVVLRERAQKVKVKLDDLSIDGSGVSLSKRARVSTARIKGIVHIDIFSFINNILSPILQTEVLSLDAVSSEILGDEKIEMEYSEMLKIWKEGKNLEVLAAYAVKDAELTYKLFLALSPQIFELTRIVGQSLFDISRMTYSQLVEWYYTKKAKETGRIIPNQPRFEEIQERQKYTYTGGYVKEPEAGLRENLAVIDFASLYPSIIATYNVSIETLNCKCCKEDGYKVPDLPYWFCKEKKGFESEVIRNLLIERQKLKDQMKNLMHYNLEFNLLNNRQLALKTIANASYGYYAFPASKWYSKECAESVSAFGRYWIKRIMKEAESYGFKPIYGDTDSAFLELGEKKKEDLLSFLDKWNSELPGVMKIELENFYLRGLFIPKEIGGGVAKKKYALIDENGNLKVRGLEKVRRDWSFLSKKTQGEILRLVLEKKDVESAVQLVRDTIKRLKELKVDIKELVVYEQLSKPLWEYKLLAPHVGAAKKLVEKGISVTEGSVIGFVIEKGTGSISDRAKPLEFAQLENIDTDYYINHQILPASLRILKVFNVDEKDILS